MAFFEVVPVAQIVEAIGWVVFWAGVALLVSGPIVAIGIGVWQLTTWPRNKGRTVRLQNWPVVGIWLGIPVFLIGIVLTSSLPLWLNALLVGFAALSLYSRWSTIRELLRRPDGPGD